MAEDLFGDSRLTAIGLLMEVHHAIADRLKEVFREYDIAGSDFDVLIRLARSPYQSLRLTDLAAQTAISTSGITRVVDRLEHAGLAERAACPGDRRAYVVGLSDQGSDKLVALLPALLEAIDECLTGLLPQDRLESFLYTLRELRDVLHPGALAGTETPDCQAEA